MFKTHTKWYRDLHKAVLCSSMKCKGHAAENWGLDGGVLHDYERNGRSQLFLSNQLKAPKNQDPIKVGLVSLQERYN
jgi:hypothetical protein